MAINTVSSSLPLQTWAQPLGEDINQKIAMALMAKRFAGDTPQIQSNWQGAAELGNSALAGMMYRKALDQQTSATRTQGDITFGPGSSAAPTSSGGPFSGGGVGGFLGKMFGGGGPTAEATSPSPPPQQVASLPPPTTDAQPPQYSGIAKALADQQMPPRPPADIPNVPQGTPSPDALNPMPMADQTPPLSGGNAPSGIDRSRFAAELQQNPELAKRLADMVNGEVGMRDPRLAQVQLESVFNRAASRGIPLSQALLSVGEDHKRGYYATDTYNRPANQQQFQQFQQNLLPQVLGGSDVGSQTLGFAPTGNASQMGFAGRRAAQGMYGDSQWYSGVPGKGEMYVVEKPDVGKIQPGPMVPPDLLSPNMQTAQALAPTQVASNDPNFAPQPQSPPPSPMGAFGIPGQPQNAPPPPSPMDIAQMPQGQGPSPFPQNIPMPPPRPVESPPGYFSQPPAGPNGSFGGNQMPVAPQMAPHAQNGPGLPQAQAQMQPQQQSPQSLYYQQAQEQFNRARTAYQAAAGRGDRAGMQAAIAAGEQARGILMQPPQVQMVQGPFGSHPVMIDPVRGTMSNLQPQGGQPSSSSGNPQNIENFDFSKVDSNATGDAYLKQFPPEIQAAVKSYMSGGVMPSGNPRNNGIATIAKTVAQKYANDVGQPQLADDALYPQRRQMYTDASKSSPNSLGGILSNGKSAFQHLSELSDKAVGLGNYNGPDIPGGGMMAHAGNYFGNALGTSQTKANIGAFNDNALKYGQEATKFYAGTGGGEAERMNAMKLLNPESASPHEIASFLETEKQLMLDRMQQKESQVRDILGDGYLQQHPVMSPELQNTISRIDANIARLRGNGPSQPQAQPQQAPQQQQQPNQQQFSPPQNWQFSPSRNQYRDPQGNVYDLNGRPTAPGKQSDAGTYQVAGDVIPMRGVQSPSMQGTPRTLQIRSQQSLERALQNADSDEELQSIIQRLKRRGYDTSGIG